MEADLSNIQYKALLSDGTWTEWVNSGTFVGSRGANAPLRGFAVRLGGNLENELDCVCFGKFVDEVEHVKVSDGDACYTLSGAQLEAMQIILLTKKDPEVGFMTAWMCLQLISGPSPGPATDINPADPALTFSAVSGAVPEPTQAPLPKRPSSQNSTPKRNVGWLSFLGW